MSYRNSQNSADYQVKRLVTPRKLSEGVSAKLFRYNLMGSFAQPFLDFAENVKLTPKECAQIF